MLEGGKYIQIVHTVQQIYIAQKATQIKNSAIVVLLYKKGEKTNLENLRRPITIIANIQATRKIHRSV